VAIETRNSSNKKERNWKVNRYTIKKGGRWEQDITLNPLSTIAQREKSANNNGHSVIRHIPNKSNIKKSKQSPAKCDG